MSIKEIRWRRGDVEMVIDPDRKTLEPLLRQTALSRIPVGYYRTEVAFDGAFIWVTNGSSSTVSKIDVPTNMVVATVGVGSYPKPKDLPNPLRVPRE
jgi:YVTN family beta-propeller protein